MQTHMHIYNIISPGPRGQNLQTKKKKKNPHKVVTREAIQILLLLSGF